VAQARKQAVSQQMKHKLDKNSADQYELESMLRKQGAELSRTKTLLSQSDFDLKEARFEINQILAREMQLKEEKRLVEVKNAEIIADLKAKLEQKSQSQEEKTQVAVFECDKMIKTLSALYKSVFDGRNSNTTAPKTSKQLLDKATSDAEHLREFLKSKSSSLLSEEQEKVTTAMHARHHTVSVSAYVWICLFLMG
jgi:septal ring factor EnvC (AmiA/AmiB activator)